MSLINKYIYIYSMYIMLREKYFRENQKHEEKGDKMGKWQLSHVWQAVSIT